MSRALLATLAVLLTVQTAEAQIWRRARDAARRGVERAIDRRAEAAAEAAVDALFDAGAEAARCVFTDDACIREASERGEDVVLTDADGTPVDRDGRPVTPDNAEDAVVRAPAGGAGGAAPSTPASAAPGEGVWANYDFVPGDRVLFAEDFESEYVGNVPRRLTFQGGTAEVVEWQGGQMLRTNGRAQFAIPLPDGVPERFTVEFDLYRSDTGSNCGNGVFLTFEEPDPDAYLQYAGVGTAIALSDCEAGVIHFGDGPASAAHVTGGGAPYAAAVTPVRIAVDGSYIKVYLAERRVANIPNGDVVRGDALYLIAADYDGRYAYVDNLRVAAGGREILLDRLMADGRVALGGLLFDTASARLRPESTPTLQDLLRTLGQNGSLRLRIEGHTDDTGAADANERLSQQRAEAVVAWLTQHGVAADRLEAVGLGPSQPVADNGTPEGRQTNRRVEVVRL